MDFFALFRKYIAMNGIILQPSPNSFLQLNFKSSTILIFAILHLIAQAKRLDDANTFEEYTDIVYKVLFLAVFIIFYVYAVWRTPTIFGFINSLDDRIRKSKHTTLHITFINQLTISFRDILL